MKKNYILVFISFFHCFLFAQINQKKDSITHYTKISDYNISLKKIDKAIYYTKKAIYYSIEHNFTQQIAFQTFKLGKLYYNTKKYDAALQNFNKSIYYYNKINPDKNKGFAYFYIGLTNVALENYSNSEYYFQKSDDVFTSLAIVDKSDYHHLKSAKAYLQKKQYNLAKNSLQKIIKNNTVSSLKPKTEAYYQLGLMENKLQKDSAAFYFEKALELTSVKEDAKRKIKILLAISKYYKNQHDYDRAYSYLEEHYQLKNHIQEIENAKYNSITYKKYKKNELLKEAQQLKEEKNEREKTKKYTQLVSIFAIGLISILSLLSLSLYRNNIIRDQNNTILKQKNDQLIIAKNKIEKASNARSEFLSRVSHELRTPLNAINGITHILIQENPKKSQIDYLESLKFSGNYLTNFINEILEINKIDSNKFEILNVNFNLKELITNIQSSLKKITIDNKNTFELIIDQKIPVQLVGDPTKLAQIITNLISNALKFTQNGHVKVLANLNAIDNETVASIDFAIVDTGIGISADKLPTIFDSFSQGSVEINRKYGGTGLGLTIVKRLIEIMGGSIKLKSEVGVGSSFSFNLKFKINPIMEPIKEITTINSNAILKDKKILLVEDNKINQMVTKKMLENKLVECIIIDNGEAAIENLKTQQYDLILMDVHLPGINGTIATKEIREFNNYTPIIALTAISLEENKESLLAFGMNDVITKPFIPEEFYATLAKFLTIK